MREVANEESQELSSFDKTKDKLDEPYYSMIGVNEKYKSLWQVVKMVLMTSHEQSTVERSFSTNKDILEITLERRPYKHSE